MFLNILKILILDDLLRFLDFWYIHFPRRTIRHYFDQIYFLDRFLKLKANLRNISKPLYGDYTFVGYIIAIPYRIFRIIFGFIIYFFLGIFYLVLFLFWLILPFFLLFYGFLFSK